MAKTIFVTFCNDEEQPTMGSWSVWDALQDTTNPKLVFNGPLASGECTQPLPFDADDWDDPPLGHGQYAYFGSEHTDMPAADVNPLHDGDQVLMHFRGY